MNLRFLPSGNLIFWLISAPFFLLLLLLSIFSVSLIVEKLLLLRRWRCRNKGFSALASRLLQQGELTQLGHLLLIEMGPEAMLLRSSFDFIRHELEGRILKDRLKDLPQMEPLPAPINTQNFEGENIRHFHASLHLPPSSITEIQNRLERLAYSIENCIARLGLQLEKHCNLFHLIANIATLLGLLGTVTGMIYAFWSGALEGGSRLSGGIAQALLTTAGGLIVAIPAIASQHLFLNAASWRVYALEQLGDKILEMEQRRLEAWMGNAHRAEKMFQTEMKRSKTTITKEATKTVAGSANENTEAARQNPDSDSHPSQESHPPQGSHSSQGSQPSQGQRMGFVARMAQMERYHRKLRQKHENLAQKGRAPQNFIPRKTANIAKPLSENPDA